MERGNGAVVWRRMQRRRDSALERETVFNYLVPFVTVTGGALECVANHWVQAGWLNFERMSVVLCDRRLEKSSKG